MQSLTVASIHSSGPACMQATRRPAERLRSRAETPLGRAHGAEKACARTTPRPHVQASQRAGGGLQTLWTAGRGRGSSATHLHADQQQDETQSPHFPPPAVLPQNAKQLRVRERDRVFNRSSPLDQANRGRGEARLAPAARAQWVGLSRHFRA